MATNIKSENFGFWMKPIKVKIQDGKYWYKARILVDRVTRQQYVDVLCGRKNRHDAHIHAGFEIQTNLPLFIEARNMVKRVRRELTTTEGKVSDEKLDLKNTKGEIDFRLVLAFNQTTKEVTINEFKITPVRID